MRRIFKNIAALALMVGALIGSVGTSDAQNYRYYNNDRHIMASIVLTALWRLCLLSVAITQTRSIIAQNAGDHPRPSTTFRVIN
jgi:hypothetical protein